MWIHRKQNKWIPQGKPRRQFCRRELACFIWSQLTHDLIPFLSHLIKLFQTPDTAAISKTHQLHAPRPPSVSKPAESLQNGWKVTRTYSNRNSSHGFFLHWNRSLKTTDQAVKTWRNMSYFRPKWAGDCKDGEFSWRTHCLTPKKTFGFGISAALQEGWHASLRDPQGRACAAPALPLLQEQAVKAAAHEIPQKSQQRGGLTVGEARTEEP